MLLKKNIYCICFALLFIFIFLFYFQTETFSICEPLSLDKLDPAKLKEADDFIFAEIDKVEKEMRKEERQQFERKLIIIALVVYMVGMVLTVCSGEK